MKTYNIPIRWESYQRFSVEAETLQEAVTKALTQFLGISDELYLDDSFQIDEIVKEEHPNEDYDIDKAIEAIYS